MADDQGYALIAGELRALTSEIRGAVQDLRAAAAEARAQRAQFDHALSDLREGLARLKKSPTLALAEELRSLPAIREAIEAATRPGNEHQIKLRELEQRETMMGGIMAIITGAMPLLIAGARGDPAAAAKLVAQLEAAAELTGGEA